ncbi:MAG: hypothetical protein R3F41_06755 [Gammaproteobacteria bacterium]|nr:hypothetical protein [Pseudomonadales bacterium]
MLMLLASSQVGAVPGFARQTGMTCNQCHTSHGAATPNFTFSGKKFNALGYRLPSVQVPDIEAGGPEDQGEYLELNPVQWSGRFQWSAISNVKPPAGPNEGDWGEENSNPTSRFAVFPFIGSIGDHFGVWTEIYIIPSSSTNDEWTISNASYEEHDFRYIINPDSKENIYGISFSNQGIGSLFGFGPWPAVGAISDVINRGGIGGYQHPNFSNLMAYGWMDDRWVWALGGNSGDTNTGWDAANAVGMVGYAFQNSNYNELWANLYFRDGDDAMPLVTGISVPQDKHDFYYSDGISGVGATRPTTCPSNPEFILNGCPYLAEDMDHVTSVDAEIRWGGQDRGNLSFEVVGRLGFNDEDYYDGAGTTKNSWSLATQFGWNHTWYFKPYLNGVQDFEFTDRSGVKYDIDTSTQWGAWLAYKPTENFLLSFEYHRLQSWGLNRAALDDGARYSLTADIAF